MMIINDIREELPRHKTKKWNRRSIRNISDVVIHHTTNMGEVFSQANYHINVRNWAGLAYHYFLPSNGIINICNDIDLLTYHCSRNNTKSIGICLQGNFNKKEPSDKEIFALTYLCNTLVSVIGPYKLGGHYQYKATSCPGENVIKILDNIALNNIYINRKK